MRVQCNVEAVSYALDDGFFLCVMVPRVYHAHSMRPTVLCSTDGCPEYSLSTTSGIAVKQLQVNELRSMKYEPERVEETNNTNPVASCSRTIGTRAYGIRLYSFQVAIINYVFRRSSILSCFCVLLSPGQQQFAPTSCPLTNEEADGTCE